METSTHIPEVNTLQIQISDDPQSESNGEEEVEFKQALEEHSRQLKEYIDAKVTPPIVAAPVVPEPEPEPAPVVIVADPEPEPVVEPEPEPEPLPEPPVESPAGPSEPPKTRPKSRGKGGLLARLRDACV